MAALRQLWHLITRFVGVMASRPLGPRAQESVTRVLGESEAELFWQQQSIDQRHAYEVAARVADSVGEDHPAVVAALLHDVGKRQSRLGAVERSLATVISLARLPMPRRWKAYRDHGEIGARDLEAIAAHPLAVAFARGTPTGGVDAAAWSVLEAADDASGLATGYRVSATEKGKAPVNEGSGNTMPPEVTT